MTRFEAIENVLQEMSTQDIVAIHNSYCDSSNNMDDWIYNMEEFDEIMSGVSPWEIARSCYFGEDFNPCCDYFRFNGYANLESFDFAPGGNSGIYTYDIAKYIDRNEESLGNDDIQNVLDEFNASMFEEAMIDDE